MEGPSGVYNFQQRSAWDVQERLEARVTFLSKVKVDNPLVRAVRSTAKLSSQEIQVISGKQYDDYLVLTACEGAADENPRNTNILALFWKLRSLSRLYKVQIVFI